METLFLLDPSYLGGVGEGPLQVGGCLPLVGGGGVG